MALGAFVLVLHSHLPYVRKAGRWPHGEEMIHEAMAETYLPLLNALNDLVEEGYQPRLTLGLTPVLLEQIGDPDVCDHFEQYLEERLALVERDVRRFSRPVKDEWETAYLEARAIYLNALRSVLAARYLAETEAAESETKDPDLHRQAWEEAGHTIEEALVNMKKASADTDGKEQAGTEYFGPIDVSHLELTDEELAQLPPPPIPVDYTLIAHRQAERDHLLHLARWYRDWFEGLLHDFRARYNRNLVVGFRTLQDQGVLDILTSMATHCYSPLVDRDSTLYAQLKAGRESSKRHLGHYPRGMWLPECGYRPAYMRDENHTSYYKPGLEEFMAEQGVEYFFTDTHVIEGGALVGKAAGDAIGPYGAIPVRHVVRFEGPRVKFGTTFKCYFVRESPVAVFGRDERTGLQVWSATHGYPGDFLYREFHRKDDQSGMQYWRITGADVDLGHKQLWSPEAAFGQVQAHADHFVNLVRGRLYDYQAATGEYGVVLSAYDTELYGHWWFEGIAWLKEVLRQLSINPDVDLVTAAEFLDAHPPEEVLDLPESSWGNGGGHWTWWNPDVYWVWQPIHRAERTMEELVARYPNATGELLDLLNQAARELLLLESSDWPFLITTGQARDYAIKRFTGHVARFDRLTAIAEKGFLDDDDRHFLAEVKEEDNPFPNLDYRWFANRERKEKIA